MSVQTFDGLGAASLPQRDISVLRPHVQQLCTQHEVTWREAASAPVLHGAECDFAARTILTPPLDSEIVYWEAVQGIGRLVLEHGGASEAEVIFKNELDAWKWALNESIITPSGAAGWGIRCLFVSREDDPPKELMAELGRAIDTPEMKPMLYK